MTGSVGVLLSPSSVWREEVVQAKTFTDVWSDVFVLQQT